MNALLPKAVVCYGTPGVDAMPVKNPNVKSITTNGNRRRRRRDSSRGGTDLELNVADPAFDVAKVDALIDAATKSFAASGGTIDRVHLVPVRRKNAKRT